LDTRVSKWLMSSEERKIYRLRKREREGYTGTKERIYRYERKKERDTGTLKHIFTGIFDDISGLLFDWAVRVGIRV
jgi:hypothetical protein